MVYVYLTKQNFILNKTVFKMAFFTNSYCVISQVQHPLKDW